MDFVRATLTRQNLFILIPQHCFKALGRSRFYLAIIQDILQSYQMILAYEELTISGSAIYDYHHSQKNNQHDSRIKSLPNVVQVLE